MDKCPECGSTKIFTNERWPNAFCINIHDVRPKTQEEIEVDKEHIRTWKLEYFGEFR